MKPRQPLFATLLFAALTLLMLLQSGTASALGEPDRFRLSGFATLGVTWSGDEDLGFHRDLYREGLYDGDASFWADSLLGLQLDARFSNTLGAAIQLVGKDRLDDSLSRSVEWAYLRYQISPEWRLRLGRTGLDIYLLSEYRSLGFSYLWTRPPMEFYTPVPFDSIDGADLTWEKPLGDGLLRTKVFGGQTSTDFLIHKQVVELKLDHILGISLIWESDLWQWRFTAADTQIDSPTGYFPGTDRFAHLLVQLSPYWPGAGDFARNMEADNKHFRYYSVGGAYNNAPWQVQGEIGKLQSGVGAYPSVENAYLSLGYQFEPATPFIVLATVKGNSERQLLGTPPPGFEAVYPLYQGALDGFNLEQDSLSLGLRRDLRHDMALKIQWDRTWLDTQGIALWDSRALPDTDPVIDTFSINLNVLF